MRRKAGRIAARGLVLLVLIAAGLGLWKRDEIARLWAVHTLFEADRIVANFSHMDRAFPTTPVPRGDDPPSPLPRGPEARLPRDVTGWIAARDVTALLVLQDGRIRHESYHLGTEDADLRIGWSLSKGFLSALLGVLVANGTVPDLDVPVSDYAPALAGSAYAGATLRDVLQMQSGVRFDEDYLDANSDINRMARTLALGGSMDGFTAALGAVDRAAGARWSYVSIDTHVIGMVIRGATGASIPELMAEHVVGPMGLEAAPTFLTDGEGVAFVLGGISATTRDYARLGQMYLQNGALNGRQIVPRDWVQASTRASANTDPGRDGYGYQWWIPEGAGPETFMARGIYGQYIYVDRPAGVVIVANAADRQFREPGAHAEAIRIFRLIAESL